MSISDARYDRLFEEHARLQLHVAQLEALIAASQPGNGRAGVAPVQNITDAERASAETRLQALQEATAHLLAATTPDEVAEVILHDGLRAVRALQGALFLRRGDEIELIVSEGYRDEMAQSFQRIPLDADIPVAVVTRLGETMYFPNLDARVSRFPHLEEIFAKQGHQAVAYVPLSSRHEVLGALNLAFADAGDFGPREQDFIQALADLAAQALERIRLFDAERQSRMEQADLAARLQTFLDAAPMGVAFLDSDLRYQHINRQLADLNLLPPEAHLDHTVRELWPNAEPFFEKILQEVMASGEPVMNHEFAGVGKYSGRFWQNSFYPVHGVAGDIIGIGILTMEVTERKVVEAALRASEAKFATAFNTSPTVLTITRLADGRFIEVNESFIRLTGYTREDVLGRTPYEIDLWVNPSQRQAGLSDLLAGRGLREVECDFRMKDGSIRTCLIAAEMILLNGDRHVMTSLTDITERKQIEMALRQSEERLRLATESAQIFSWEYDASTRLTRYSDNVEQALGFALPANMHDVWALMHPEDRELVFADFRHGLDGEKSIRHECRFVNPESGEIVWVLAQGSVVRDAEGRPVRVLGITQNIHERKSAEAVLTEQTRLLDLSSDAIIMRDASDRIVYWNRGAESMYGYSRDEVLGRVVFTLFKVRFPQPIEEIKAVLWREGHWEGELEQTRKDGSQITVLTRWILDRASGQDGKSASVLVINTDITARKKAEQALHENQEMLALTMRGGRIGAWWRDLDTNAVWWSRELEEIFGLAPGGFEGSEAGFYEFVLEEDRPAVARAVEKAIAEHSDYAVEFRFRHAGGSIGWMDGRGRATYTHGGRPLRLYGIGIDITERKRAEIDARFLADLSQIFTSTVDAPALMWQVSGATAEHLQVSRAGFAIIDEAKRQAVIHRDFCNGVPSMAGVYHLWWMSAGMMNDLHAGRLMIINDAQKDPLTAQVYSQALEPSGLRSVLAVPLLRMGRCVAAFFVSQNQPHVWTTAEVDLLRTVAERAWLAVESARLQSETQALNATLEARVAERTEALNHSHEQLRQLSAHVERTREDERTRIAREVHDELGGALTVLKMSLAQVNKRVEPHAAISPKLEDMRAQIDALVQTVRRISYDLRPSMLDDFGLLAAMEWQAHEWERRTGIKCKLAFVTDMQVDLSDRCRTAVFRAFQESLTNVARHSQATEVIVSVQVNEELVLKVQDNGHGINQGKMQGSKSLGLIGMRERMREVGGDVEIASVAGEGVTVTLRVPLDQHER